nr:hypothetical protein [Tanacetum cinerariifolium]
MGSIYSVSTLKGQENLGIKERGRDILRDQGRRCGYFKDQKMDCGASNKLVGEGVESLWCLITCLVTKWVKIEGKRGKFDGKSDEGFFVGYSLSSKAFRVYNTRTRKLHVQFQMNLQKDASYFDSPSKDVEDGPHNEDDDKDKSEDDSSPKEVNAASNISSDPHSPTDMFKLGASHTLKATHVEFFSDRDAPKVDLGNIPNSYRVPTTSHTRIHKDHPIKNVIGEVKSPIQTRRMTKPTSEKGIAKALSDSSWVEALQEELLQFKLQQVWILVDFPFRKKAIRTKWVFRNKKDERGIVIKNKASQDKYVNEILKKFNYSDVQSASTLVDLEKPLVKDGDANDVDVYLYRSMIGSLMYLTTSRPDIMFAVCTCARFQVTPKTSYLLAIKRIFRYLKGKPTLGLWYLRDYPFELVAYTDSDYVRATQDRKSTTGEFKTLRYLSLVVPLKKAGDEVVHNELGDRMERAATTASSLEAKHDSGDVEAQTRFEAASKQFNDPPLLRVNTLGCGEDIIKLKELMDFCTKLTSENGEIKITATIDGRVKSVTEASIRRHLKLEDSEGIRNLPNTKIFKQLALMGYVSNSDRLSFQKGHFSSQWRFYIHTILHCFSPKKTAWE